MPMNIVDLMFSHIALTKAVEKLFKPTSFIRDLFFKEEEFVDSNLVAWDYFVGTNNIPEPKPYGTEAHVVSRPGYETMSTKIPCTREKILLTTSDALRRVMGEGIFVKPGDADEQRISRILNKDLKNLLDRINRFQEYLCVLEFTEGKINIQTDDYSLKIDFNIPEGNVLGTDVEWQSNTAKIWDDICKLADTVADSSQTSMDSLIVGREAFACMMGNKNFREIYDNRRVDLGQIKPKSLPNGGVYMGNLVSSDMDLALYQYRGSVTTYAGVEKNFIDPKKIYIGTEKNNNSFVWGRCSDLRAGDSKVFVKRWEDSDPNGVWLLAESCSIPLLKQPSAFGRMTVVA